MLISKSGYKEVNSCHFSTNSTQNSHLKTMKNERKEQAYCDEKVPTPSNDVTSIDFGRAIEIVGIAGIILSLIFLGYELKRSNDIAETQAVATIYSMTNEMGLALAENPELSRVFGQALSDFESLSPDDRFTLYVLLEYVINVNEAAWKFYDKGIINQEEADFYTRNLCQLIGRHPSLVEAWRSNKQHRLPGFYEYATGVCEL
jgi:hypothetical protein